MGTKMSATEAAVTIVDRYIKLYRDSWVKAGPPSPAVTIAMVQVIEDLREHVATLERHNPCPACPVEVRGLHAAASNAVGSVERWLTGEEDYERALRKIRQLKTAVDTMQTIVDAHFANKAHWEPETDI